MSKNTKSTKTGFKGIFKYTVDEITQLEKLSSKNNLMALEPRILLDAAGGAEIVDAAVSKLIEHQVDVAIDQSVDHTNSDGNDDGLALIAALERTSSRDSERNEIVFIDSAIENRDQILLAIDSSVEVIVIDSEKDGVEQIADALKSRTDIDAIHIFSNGSEGSLSLGSSTLNAESISGEHADELAIVKAALADSGDILIYGCNFGAGSGEEVALQLALATGADIAASDDLTGAESLGGDWDLEIEAGVIEARTIEAREFGGVLVDSDGDGVDDAVDLDSDNDGITDITEKPVVVERASAPAAETIGNAGTFDEASGSLTQSNYVTGDPANNWTFSFDDVLHAQSSASGTFAFSTYSNGSRDSRAGVDVNSHATLDLGDPSFVSTPDDVVLSNTVRIYELDATSGTYTVKLTDNNGNPMTLDDFTVDFTGPAGTTLNGPTAVAGQPGVFEFSHANQPSEGAINLSFTSAAGTLIKTAEFTLTDYASSGDFIGMTSTREIARAIDSDGDGINNHLDLDSDNDGITDNVEAQTTAGYIKPTGIDADNDGLDDAYDANVGDVTDAASVGLTLVDTDGDGTADYSDADSDNDGVDDIVESGTGATSLTSTTDSDNDGLLDIFEGADNNDGYNVNDENLDAADSNFLLSEKFGSSELDFRDFGIDTDGDRIADHIDIDDDNDGITDMNERADEIVQPIENNFENWTRDGSWTAYTSGSDSFALNNQDETGSELSTTADLSNVVNPAVMILPVYGNNASNLANSTGFAEATFSIDGVDYLTVRNDVNDNSIMTVTTHNGASADRTTMTINSWTDIELSLPTTTWGEDAEIKWTYTAVEDDIRVGIPTFTEDSLIPPYIDRDGDGILDHLDLDSDKDGITDNVEAQTTAGYIKPTGVDADGDGLDDAYDANVGDVTDAGSVGLALVDTDGDGTVDYSDADSDNDGVDDIVESGTGATSLTSTTDTDNDGLADIFEGADSNDGYNVNDENLDAADSNFLLSETFGSSELNFREFGIDTDGDGVADHIDIDDDNDGIVDDVEAPIVSESVTDTVAQTDGDRNDFVEESGYITSGRYEGANATDTWTFTYDDVRGATAQSSGFSTSIYGDAQVAGDPTLTNNGHFTLDVGDPAAVAVEGTEVVSNSIVMWSLNSATEMTFTITLTDENGQPMELEDFTSAWTGDGLTSTTGPTPVAGQPGTFEFSMERER